VADTVVAGDGVAGARARWQVWSAWTVLFAAVLAGLVALRPYLDNAHVALALLMVVLGGSAAAGQRLGITLAVAAFFGFNFFFVLPYHTLVVAHPLDWLVLAAFLATGLVGARLLARAQDRAATASRRTAEVERLAALGAEALSAGGAEDALRGVLEVIRTTLRVARCEILLPRGASPALVARLRGVDGPATADTQLSDALSLAAWVAEKGAVAAECQDGTKWTSEPTGAVVTHRWPPAGRALRALYVPLQVRGRLVGVLSITHPAPFTLDPSQEQFLSALSYYAALGVERVALVAEAERAEAFREADALKAALLSGVSHDLRTPLTTIKALAQRMVANGNTEAGLIEEEADRLNRLVADLLDLSRLNAGALPLRLEVNAAEDLAGAAMRQLAAVAGAGKVTTRIEGARDQGGPPLLLGRFDFTQSLRALVNLLENAVKYSPAGEPVELVLRQGRGFVEFVVMDRGPGVPRDERERIFEPFYRGPGVPPDVGGAGLGLSIARRLTMEQGGDVTFEPREGLPAVELPPVTG
jgi:two-component system, OmpR family, sensor histidine kinase KdpD